jgi:hypothetical protein
MPQVQSTANAIEQNVSRAGFMASLQDRVNGTDARTRGAVP